MGDVKLCSNKPEYWLETKKIFEQYLWCEKQIAEGALTTATLAYRDGLLLHLCARIDHETPRTIFEYVIMNLRGLSYSVDDYGDLVADMISYLKDFFNVEEA